MYQQTVVPFTKMLENLSKWIDVAEEHAKTKKFEPNTWTTARLIADQYPFARQVQAACDAAKISVSRLTAKEAPKHEDNETTLDELRQRIHKCTTYLKTIQPEDFKGSEERRITLPWFEGKSFSGEYYLNHFAMQNFYFHITTAFAILRSNGVDIGKMAYIGGLEFDKQ